MFTLLLVSLILPLAFSKSDCDSSRNSGYSCPSGKSKFFFFFDSRSKVCQPFLYRGCGGNENRFGSREECLAACKNPSENSSAVSPVSLMTSPGSQWLQAEKCGSNYLIPNHKYVACDKEEGCPPQHSCTDSVCCPNKKLVCSLRDDTGNFAEGIEDKPRFAWSDAVKSCVRFSYYGANGNYNNFPNFQSCMRFCKT